jgi:hypothetical protein
MASFLDGLGCTSSYVRSAVDLLLSPRKVVDKRQKDKPWVTKKGILMGEPLTKVVLTIISFVASLKSLKDVKIQDRIFASAGDDQILFASQASCLEHMRLC